MKTRLVLVVIAGIALLPSPRQTVHAQAPIDRAFQLRFEMIKQFARGTKELAEWIGETQVKRYEETGLAAILEQSLPNVTQTTGLLVTVEVFDQITGEGMAQRVHKRIRSHMGLSVNAIAQFERTPGTRGDWSTPTGYRFNIVDSYMLWYTRKPNGQIDVHRKFFGEFRGMLNDAEQYYSDRNRENMVLLPPEPIISIKFKSDGSLEVLFPEVQVKTNSGPSAPQVKTCVSQTISFVTVTPPEPLPCFERSMPGPAAPTPLRIIRGV
jgi:hypothetical protein